MWILPWPLPPDARVRLPPGRHRFPWYHTPAETARLAELLTGILDGVDRHLIIPWSAAKTIASAGPQQALKTTLLVAIVEDPDLSDDSIEETLQRIPCPHEMVKLPQPRSVGYAWQERYIKPALVSILQEHLDAPDHPLASLNMAALPVKRAAGLTTDVLELVDLLEAAAEHRMAHASEGLSAEDYERSLLEEAGRALASRLLRLRMDQVPGALGIILDGGRGNANDEVFRDGAEALEVVGLARYAGGGLSLGPLARRANEPALRAALLKHIPEPLRAPPAPAPPSPRSSRDASLEMTPRKDADLEDRGGLITRVEHVARLRHRDGIIERIPGPPPFTVHLRVTEHLGEVAYVRLIQAVEGEVTEDILEKFLREVVEQYRIFSSGLLAILVYTGRRAPESLVRRAAAQRVQVVGFSEYQGLIDFGNYVERQTRRLENDRVYPPSLYVDQRAILSAGRQESAHDNALNLINELLDTPQGRFVLVLGDFGTGKTFLLHELARRMGSAGGPLVPVLVEMRALEKARSLDALIAQHFALSGMDRIDLAAFRYLLAEGRIALLFDGFDELALRVTFERAAQHFATLVEAAQGNAKIIATSRTQHFLNEQQIKTALGERADRIPGARLVKLLPFSEPQIRKFLVNRLFSEERADARLRLIDEVKDLLGLAQNPRMLSFIAEIEESSLLQAKQREGEITSAGLYRLLLERWIVHEFDRAHPKGVSPGLTATQRWRAVTELARLLWTRTDRAIDILDLPAELYEAIQALGPEPLDVGEMTQQIGSGTLLVRDEQGRFSFIHQSVLEWLVANAAAEEVKHTGRSTALAAREMSHLMADFFWALVGREAAIAWARTMLDGGGGAHAVKNALRVLWRLDLEATLRFDLAGHDLRGQDISGEDFRGADLRGTDLSDARLVGTNLEGANLADARMLRADLSKAILVQADLSRADLTGARLLGANLHGATITCTRLRYSSLVGALFDRRALDQADLFGAAFEVHNRVDTVLAALPPCRCASIAFSPDGALLASAHDDGTIRIWDIATGALVRLLQSDKSGVLSIAFSPDGETLASGSDNGSIHLWSAATGSIVVRIDGHSAQVWRVSFSADGQSLASASADGTACIWNPRSGERLRIHTYQGRTASAAFSPDGLTLAAGSGNAVHLWDLTTGIEQRTFPGLGDSIWSISFSPDAMDLASGHADGTVRVWETRSGRGLMTLDGHAGAVLNIAFSPIGRTLASTSDDSVRLWDITSGTMLRTFEGHQGNVWSIAFSPSCRTLACATSNGSIHLWDIESGKRHLLLQVTPTARIDVAFFDGQSLISTSARKVVRAWDVRRGVEQRVLRDHQAESSSLAVSPDGRWLAIGSSDHVVELWDVASGVKVQNVGEHHGDVYSIVFSPDGRTLATLSEDDENTQLWDLSTGKKRGSTGAWGERPLAFSPDSQTIATVSYLHEVHLWDTNSGSSTRALGQTPETISTLAFNPTTDTMATAGGNTIRFWDLSTSTELFVIEGHRRPIRCIAFSPDGVALASGSDDSTICLWDASDGAQRLTLHGHQGAVHTIAFSRDGTILASASDDGTIRLWSASTGEHLATLIAGVEGWATVLPDGRYKLGGDIAGAFWHAINMVRFEPGELDPYVPGLRIPDDEPILPARAALPRKS